MCSCNTDHFGAPCPRFDRDKERAQWEKEQIQINNCLALPSEYINLANTLNMLWRICDRY